MSIAETHKKRGTLKSSELESSHREWFIYIVRV